MKAKAAEGNTTRSAEFVEVTPALAREWLSKNHNNRPLKKNRIEIYAKDIKENRWGDSNDGVAFGQDGTLYNGQNRLAAVILANRPVRMLVIRGLAPEARLNMDIGTKRSTGDTFTIVYGGKRWMRKTAIVRSILHLTQKRVDYWTNDEIKKTYDTYAAGVDWASTLRVGGHISFTAPISAALAYAYPKNPEAVMDFADRVISGEGLTKNDPILVFRDQLVSRALRQGAAREASLKTLRAVMARLKGEEMVQLKVSETGFDYFTDEK